jgi:hypothetical protein
MSRDKIIKQVNQLEMWGRQYASNPDGPYRVIEIVALIGRNVGQLCATIDDSAALRSRNAMRALT